MSNDFMKKSLKLSAVIFFGLLIFIIFTPRIAEAENIFPDAPPVYKQWSWNEVIGWIDFRPEASVQCPTCPNVSVFDNRIEGYASSSVGFIALNCNITNPSGVNICATSNFFVSNDSAGNLAGWAWNDQIGWISFCGNPSGGSVWNGSTWICPTTGGMPTYQVRISTAGSSQGEFLDWAWNDVVGWISFNCLNIGGFCTNINYKVRTSWLAPPPQLEDGSLVSSIFDTCPSGAPPDAQCGSSAINTIMWRGNLPFNTLVRFQIASSNCENGSTNAGCILGSWDIDGGLCALGDSCFLGDSDNTVTYYPGLASAEPGIPIKINSIHHNKRYLRYRVDLLICDGASTPPCIPTPQTPRIDDIIINWSP